jgi:hypothetical protein
VLRLGAGEGVNDRLDRFGQGAVLEAPEEEVEVDLLGHIAQYQSTEPDRCFARRDALVAGSAGRVCLLTPCVISNASGSLDRPSGDFPLLIWFAR